MQCLKVNVHVHVHVHSAFMIQVTYNVPYSPLRYFYNTRETSLLPCVSHPLILSLLLSLTPIQRIPSAWHIGGRSRPFTFLSGYENPKIITLGEL